MATFLVEHVDTNFVRQFGVAGEPNQQVVAEFLLWTQKKQAPMRHEGVKRFYYLHHEDPKISIVSIGHPLEEWSGKVMVQVGSQEVIGEFAGNELYAGLAGTKLTIRPWEWHKAPAEKSYPSASVLLEQLELPLLVLQVVIKASYADRPDFARLPYAYKGYPRKVAPHLVSLQLRGIEKQQAIGLQEARGLLEPQDLPAFDLACSVGCSAWILHFSDGTKVLHVQSTHVQWNLVVIVEK